VGEGDGDGDAVGDDVGEGVGEGLGLELGPRDPPRPAWTTCANAKKIKAASTDAKMDLMKFPLNNSPKEITALQLLQSPTLPYFRLHRRLEFECNTP
jgi:hypothetical protein